ncbi:MAG: oxalyl-CoA decarboxylase [Pseudomonadales bacterium]|jgi:2-hydroxyacyl-CoA lyase 1|nr:oxalyl-CoA decarboxylase [Pseudomonadales bacterium]MDP7360678.1 oxalyl-CoA decarboxylase [Pseudomonadales bacterium]MDP7594227.1 oxalyl-CoA decarboxylase [Pseudomonadales bacterium]HJN52930.1 oxalyl-CoA decarboxylase [Pseudomonadales bacterium]|tara:strand:- start:1094 stop:2746 length:1653 start_codon:yes stop_codon:yes gene_type:complete
MATINGATLVARNLKQQGVDYMYGIVGFPVGPIATAAQREGITYIGMRNEQAASYAAQAAGYLTGRPQACLTVSGPGVIHALAGLANAQSNCWPMILLGGASDTEQNGMGAFQEERQVMAASQFCKYAHAVESVGKIPYYVEQAVRSSIFGRPGAVYLDMPDDVILGQIEEEDVRPASTVPEPPRVQAVPESVDAALNALESAERPLVIVGKGMAWSRAESEVRDFIERTQLPFLASPMGKGVMDDNNPLSVGAARTLALKEADVILLMGARLNWIMHFGLPPRFAEDVRILQMDIAAEEISTNVPAEVALVGDGKAVVSQLNTALKDRQWFYPVDTAWRSSLAAKAQENQTTVEPMIADNAEPMNYYRAFKDISEWMPDDAIIVSEGANTMDIGRTQMPNSSARSRLDAGSYGTMGVGMGFAIAAATVHPDRPVVAVEGDAGFGFSGMEVETACRYKLPIKIIVLNNGGIGGGVEKLNADRPVPPSVLTPGARYDKMMASFDGLGILVKDPADLRAALDEAMAFDGPALVNVLLHPRAGRKPQQYQWHT